MKERFEKELAELALYLELSLKYISSDRTIRCRKVRIITEESY